MHIYIEEGKKQMTTPYQKQFAVVTGASNGIGFELAKQFAQNNFDLLIAAEPDNRLEAARNSLQAIGANVETIGVDLAQYDEVEKLYARIKSSGRPVDAIAFNAGVGIDGDFAQTTRLEDELNIINLNVTSTVHLAKRVLKDMSDRGSGRVLFTSSIAAIMPAPFEAVYGASKAFILSFSEALRNELKDTGVSITALLPGPTETDFFHRANMDDTKAGADPKDDPADVAKQGFEALMSGKDKIIAGSLKTKMQGLTADILPDTVTSQMHRGMSEPGSAYKK